jgi:hypothetical protein
VLLAEAHESVDPFSSRTSCLFFHSLNLLIFSYGMTRASQQRRQVHHVRRCWLLFFCIGVGVGCLATVQAALLLNLRLVASTSMQTSAPGVRALIPALQPQLRRSPRNVVLALAEGIEYEGVPGVRWVARFGGSFRRSNENADIVFFTSSVDPAVAPLLESVRITPVTFDPAPPPPWGIHEVATRRWHIFREYLDSHPEYADGWVLAIDARDTYFQRDPFSFPHSPGEDPRRTLYAYLEQDVTIETSSWNAQVIRACYPEAVLASIGSHVVSCSGTVLAAYDAMVDFLRAMEEEALMTNCTDTGGRDQGFHNVLLYTGKLAARGIDVRLFSNDDGPVQTLQFGHLYRDALGRVLNARGDVAHIVHQWDRKPE